MHSHISCIKVIANITNPVASIAVVVVIIANAIVIIAIVDIIDNVGADVGNGFNNDDDVGDNVGVPVKLALSNDVGKYFGDAVNPVLVLSTRDTFGLAVVDDVGVGVWHGGSNGDDVGEGFGDVIGPLLDL